MATIIIEILIVIALLALMVVNRIGISRTKKRRKNMCWKHRRNIVLGTNASKMNAEVDLVADKNMLRMHNKGTRLQDETERLKFIAISDNRELFWKRKANR